MPARCVADVWTALGGELKPSLDVVVSALMDTGRRFPAGPRAEAGGALSVAGDEPVAHHVLPEDENGERRVAMTRPHGVGDRS